VVSLIVVGFIVGGLWATRTRPGHPVAGNCRLAQPLEHSIAAIPRNSERRG
jgi:hypothetical protein